MIIASLFSGIGLLDLGFQREGFETKYFVENDEYCQAVLRERFPDKPIYGDIRKVDFTKTPRVDGIIGGIPCQPASYAGSRKGNKDSRWLWPEFERAIKEAKPKFVVLENVPGLISLGLGEVLDGFRKQGYTTLRPVLIEAASVGAPHRRERIFIVAYSNDSRYTHGKPQINAAEGRQQAFSEPKPSCNVPDTNGARSTEQLQTQEGRSEKSGFVSNTTGSRLEGKGSQQQAAGITGSDEGRTWEEITGWKQPSPLTELRRMANGRTERLELYIWKNRIKALGNGVCVQVGQEIAKAVKAMR